MSDESFEIFNDLWQWHFGVDRQKELRGILERYEAKVTKLEALTPFLCHLNLDCYEGCTCGLDAVTDAAKLPRCDSTPT